MVYYVSYFQICNTVLATVGFPGGTSGKEPTCQCRKHKRLGFDPRVGKIPWSRKWWPTPVFLPGKFHGQRSLADYSPWGPKESDIIEHTCMCVHACVHTHTHTDTLTLLTVVIMLSTTFSFIHSIFFPAERLKLKYCHSKQSRILLGKCFINFESWF